MERKLSIRVNENSIRMQPLKLRNILWDVDGTLFDTYPAISAAILAALAEQHVTLEREKVTRMAMTSLGTTLPDLARRYRLDFQRLVVRYEFFLAGTPLGSQPPFPGVKELLKAIKKSGGLNLIATHRGRDSLLPLLKYHRLHSYFSDILTIGDGYPRKPNPAMFNELMARHNLDPKDCLAIGDRDIDLEAGRRAGVTVALYGQAPHKVEPDLYIAGYVEFIRDFNSNRKELKRPLPEAA